MLKIDVKIDKGVARLGKLPDDIRATLRIEARSVAAMLKQTARAKASGDVIGVRSGKYVKSITTSVRANKSGVRGKLYSKSPLANIFVNGAQIPAHFIAPKNVKALHFIGSNGEEIFAGGVNVPGAQLKARDVIISTGRQKREEIKQRMNDALVDGIRANADNAL